MENNMRTVLSIDPGYERLGVAILKQAPGKKEELLYSNCVRTEKSLPHAKRLAVIAESLTSLIEKYSPDILATETLFFSVNQKTAMQVAEARGVILATGALHGLTVCEYSPLQVKVATTGDGRADKKQIIAMIPQLIALHKEIMFDDEFDAIAIGITCLAREKELR
jgi:crossover junction endodeoxyribonuclease RuvC